MSRTSPRRRRVTTLVAALLAAVLLASAGVGAASATAAGDERVTVSNETIEPNASETLRVALADAPDGLAGYKATLEFETDGVATITGAGYPDEFGMTTDPDVADDGQSVTLEAVDVRDGITAGDSNVTLATVTVAGDGDGETGVRVTDVRMDADGGDRIEPARGAGAVAVSAADGEASAGDGPGGESDSTADGESDDGSGSATDDGGDEDEESDDGALPGFGALGAVSALLAAALFARRGR